MVINEIRLDPRSQTPDAPLVFRTGEPIIEGGHIVKEIKFFNPMVKPFNKNSEVVGAVYVVYFNEIPERRIIVAETVTSVEAVAEKFTKNAFELPD